MISVPRNIADASMGHVLSAIGWSLTWPFRQVRDGAEFRRLRRRLRHVHRLWVSVPGGIRPETDSEYLERLRRLERERFGR